MPENWNLTLLIVITILVLQVIHMFVDVGGGK